MEEPSADEELGSGSDGEEQFRCGDLPADERKLRLVETTQSVYFMNMEDGGCRVVYVECMRSFQSCCSPARTIILKLMSPPDRAIYFSLTTVATLCSALQRH